MDAWVGTLREELKKLGITDNTLIVLMADNGPPGMEEAHCRGGKGDYLEGAVRVPCIAYWPNVIAPGQTVHRP